MKRWLLPSLVLVALIGTYFLYQAKKPDAQSVTGVKMLSSPEIISTDTANGAQTYLGKNESIDKTKSAHPFPELPKNRKNIPLDKDIFGPQSVEEQAWLDRNGFPTFEQVSAYSVASNDLLKQAAEAGDSTARVFLDQHRLLAGDATAEADLLQIAANGSMYAISSLASAYGSSKTVDNSKRAYAMTRVSEMLGDNKVGLTRDFIVQTPLESPDRMQAEAEALKIYAELVEARRKKYGLNVRIVDPRPITIVK